jgi:hypothetical protein
MTRNKRQQVVQLPNQAGFPLVHTQQLPYRHNMMFVDVIYVAQMYDRYALVNKPNPAVPILLF